MSCATRDQLDDRARELWDQKGAVGALANLAQTIRNCAHDVAGAVESVALELDRERRGDLSVAQRSDSKVVADTITRLLDECLLSGAEQADIRRQVMAALHPECMGASQ